MSEPHSGWALALFRRSVLKQAKMRALVGAMADGDRGRCLDLGGDNGIISYLLRARGGTWVSADIGARNVRSIRALVGARVCQIDGVRLPFTSRSFDLVVIVDLLEHVEDDASLAVDLARVLRPGGVLVVNVPHVKRRSLLAHVRRAVGLTDAWHGHVRPGYTAGGLSRLLGDRFRIESVRTYSRAFSESIDLLLNGAYLLHRGSGEQSGKGTVVTAADVSSQQGSFRLLGAAYPLLRAFSALDVLLPLQPGYKLVVRAVRTSTPTAGGRSS